jgi:hypothetical protein
MKIKLIGLNYNILRYNMNERIRQLAGQALDQVVPYTWTRLDYDEIQRLQEYFAELIVKECAEICENYAEALDMLEDRGEPADFFQGGVKSASRRNANAIKKHFGVEE